MDTFGRNQPVLFVLILTVAWLVLLLILTGIASSVFRRPYGDAVTGLIGRLLVTAGVLWLAWRLGWLEASGVLRPGSWQVWLLALGGLVYFTGASLYSFYGKVAFDFINLVRLPDSRTIITTQFVVGVTEEIMFRGLVLYALTRVWGNTTLGIIGSVLLSSLLFAALHIIQVFAQGMSPTSALLLTIETTILSVWWGALVVLGGSIWPVVMLHFLVNAIVGLQGLMAPTVEPGILAYQRILWFSLPLGLLGIILLLRGNPHLIAMKMPQWSRNE